MLRLSLGLALCTQPCLSAMAWAEAVTGTADVGASTKGLTISAPAVSATAWTLEPLPGRPEPIQYLPNQPVDDFFAVTLISLPFMALWGLVGALVVGGVAQKRFPPELDNTLLTGAASFAVGASVATGLVSIHWGGPKASKTPVPSTNTKAQAQP